MARATIEATAKDKGSTTGNLQAKIKALHDNGHIRAYVKESADNVRHFGNDSVHGEVTTPITEEEAELVIALMIRVLDEVYQGPAEVQEAERMLAERKARGKG